MAFDWDTEPTPTWGEFGQSFYPWTFVPTDLEGLLYFEIKLGAIVAPAMARAAYVMATTGATWETAAFAATDSYSFYRVFSKARTAYMIATTPAFALGTGAFLAQYHTLTSPAPTVAHRSEPGQTSWWRAVAQSLVGGVGIGGADVGIS